MKKQKNEQKYTSTYVDEVPLSQRTSAKTIYVTETLETLEKGKTICFDFVVSKKFATDKLQRKSINGKTYFTRISK